MEDKLSKFRDALKKDFHNLYQREYSIAWQSARTVRDTEIEIMDFPNVEKLLETEKEKE